MNDNYTRQKKKRNPNTTCNFLWKINSSKKNVVEVLSIGIIEPSASIEIASENNANEKQWILWKHVIIKKCKACSINHITCQKCLIFLYFWVELCKALENEWQEINLHEEMLFLVKIWCFYKKRIWFFWKILILVTHGLMAIFDQCSKFQNDLINILGDMTS